MCYIDNALRRPRLGPFMCGCDFAPTTYTILEMLHIGYLENSRRAIYFHESVHPFSNNTLLEDSWDI